MAFYAYAAKRYGGESTGMERWELLDNKGNPTGETMVRGEKLKSGQYHLVVHIWIVDDTGRLLIQKRAPHLKLMPGVWAVTGGSAILGEDGETAARRELSEELGIGTEAGEMRHMGRLRRRNSFCDLWLLKSDVVAEELTLQAEEVARAQWVSWGKLMDMVNRRSFHNYGREYFEYVRAHIFE